MPAGKYIKEAQINLRCKPEDKAIFTQAALDDNRTLAGWVLNACKERVERQSKQLNLEKKEQAI